MRTPRVFIRKSGAASGFTLLEVILAIAIAVVLAGFIFSLYMTLSRSVDGHQGRRAGGAALAHALHQVAHDLTGAQPVFGYAAGGLELTTQEGPRGPVSIIRFSTPRADGLPEEQADDLRWFRFVSVEYQLRTRPQERDELVRLERPLVGPDALMDPVETVLAVGVDQFQVELYVDDDWVDAWSVDVTEEEPEMWPARARIRLVGDQRTRGERHHELEVPMPVGWTFAPRDE